MLKRHQRKYLQSCDQAWSVAKCHLQLCRELWLVVGPLAPRSQAVLCGLGAALTC